MKHHSLTEIDGVCETLSVEASMALDDDELYPKIHLHWEVSTVLEGQRKISRTAFLRLCTIDPKPNLAARSVHVSADIRLNAVRISLQT